MISSWLNQLEEIEDHVDAVRKKVKETATANKGLSTGERATYFQSLKVLLKRRWKDTKKNTTTTTNLQWRVQAAPWGAEGRGLASRDEEKRMGSGSFYDGCRLIFSNFDGWRLNFRVFDGWRFSILSGSLVQTLIRVNICISKYLYELISTVMLCFGGFLGLVHLWNFKIFFKIRL